MDCHPQPASKHCQVPESRSGMRKAAGHFYCAIKEDIKTHAWKLSIKEGSKKVITVLDSPLIGRQSLALKSCLWRPTRVFACCNYAAFWWGTGHHKMNSQQIKTFFFCKFFIHYGFSLTIYYLYFLILLSKTFNIMKGIHGRSEILFY